MDISASEWSSGCESGWTLYLNESSQCPNQYQKASRKSLHSHHHRSYRENGDDEEDLSMVSDASSGPPHFQYEDEGEDDGIDFCQKTGFFCPSSSSEKSKKNKAAKETRTEIQHSFLDDTASSPALSYPNRCMDQSNNQPSLSHLFGFSQGNGIMENSAFGNQIGFWQSTHSRQQEPAEASRSRGRRRG